MLRNPLKKEEVTEERSSIREKARWGIAHIYSSYNNTFVHITDITGSETIAVASGGHITKVDRLESSPATAIGIVKKVVELAKEKGITGIHIRVRAPGGHNGPKYPGPGCQTAVRSLARSGLQVGYIEEVTPLPHDGCRRMGGRRRRNLKN